MKLSTFKTLAFGAFAMALGTQANAALITQAVDGDNDCPGYFGGAGGDGGFSACMASWNDPDGPDLEPTPSIIQFEFNDEGDGSFTVTDISTQFATITGDEFSFIFEPGGGVGTWTYTPGAGDPLITAFTAKAGNGFNLFYDSAGAMLTGGWITPLNQQGAPRGLSHLTFFDMQGNDGGGGGGGVVPEPGSLVLLGTGLVGAATRLRRRLGRDK